MSIKNTIIRLLPERAQARLKKAYYRKVVDGFTEADWPYSELVRKLAPEGSAVVDAGANIGYITKLLSSFVGPDGNVYSFEPIPTTNEVLANNIQSLSLDNVQSFAVALSNESGEVQMQVPLYDGGGENYYEAQIIEGEPTDKNLRSFAVKQETLDAYLAKSELPVRFMKIDVEGHELALIQGSSLTLDQHRPALLIEVNGDPEEGKSQLLFERLSELGYSSWILKDEQLQAWAPPAQAVDYLFLQEEHKSILGL